MWPMKMQQIIGVNLVKYYCQNKRFNIRGSFGLPNSFYGRYWCKNSFLLRISLLVTSLIPKTMAGNKRKRKKPSCMHALKSNWYLAKKSIEVVWQRNSEHGARPSSS